MYTYMYIYMYISMYVYNSGLVLAGNIIMYMYIYTYMYIYRASFRGGGELENLLPLMKVTPPWI